MEVNDTARAEAEMAVAKLSITRETLSAAKNAIPNPGLFRRRARIRAHQALDGAQREFRHALEGVTRARVGALPMCWGLLSDDIEETLERYVDFAPESAIGPELRALVEHIRSELFAARICAHNGDRALEQKLTRELVQCVNLEPRAEHARRLLHHLPGSQRPIPGVDLGAVRRALQSGRDVPFADRYFHYLDTPGLLRTHFLRTFTVSFKNSDTLELHDIIVGSSYEKQHQPPRGRGLGTAALQHLCRSADHYGLNIVGKIMPGDRTEHSAARLAKWYTSSGFTVTQQTTGEFLWATLHRKPRTGEQWNSVQI
ncbi:hypothetical protein [Mycobacterium sp.]|uniref:hypothetical protein n=1 Tax=Mycobacterium sp. TaxID=1785 RepID=UPI003BAB030B